MDWDRFALRLLAVIEALGALAGCLLVCLVIGLVLFFLLVSPTYQATLELVPRPGEPAPPEEIVERVEGTGLVPAAEIVEESEGPRLLLTGLPAREVPHEVIVLLLSESGYGIGEMSVIPEFGEERIIREVGVPYLTLQALVFILAGGLLVHFRVGRGSRPARSRPLASASLGLVAGLGAFLASLALAQLVELLGFDLQEQQWVLDLLRDRRGFLRLAPWLVLIVPVSEEVFFRGYMLRWLCERAGEPTGFAVSTLAFALVHFHPQGIPIYFSVGLIFAWIYKRTGSLLAPVVAHVVYNSIVLAVALQSSPGF